MTISSTDDPRAGPFNGNGSQTAFPFLFKAFSKNDLLVVRTDADGLESTLVLDSDFSVALNGDQDANPGGTVTYPISGSALPTGETLTIVSDLDFTQTTDITTGGGFYPQVVENALDRVTMLVKQVNSAVRRSLRLAVSTPNDVDTTLPAPEADAILGWKGDAKGLRNVNPSTLATVVAFAAWQSQAFNGDGAATAFALSSDPGNINNLDVFVSGVPQRNGIDFTVSGTTLTFTNPPVAGTLNVFVRWGQALPQGGVGDGVVENRHVAASANIASSKLAITSELSSVANAARGTGMVAHDDSLSYPAGTAGFLLKPVADSLGVVATALKAGTAVTIACFGDSTMWGDTGAGVQVSTPPPSSLQDILRRFYRNTAATVTNNAISGTTSSEMLAGTDGSGSTFEAKMAASSATVVMCNHGINDAVGLNPVTASQYRLNLTKFVRICRFYGKTPVIVTPIPNWPVNTRPIARCEALKHFATIAREVAKQMGVALVDQYIWIERMLATGKQTSLTLMPDGVHPSAAVYAQMGRNLAIPILGQIDPFTGPNQYQSAGSAVVCASSTNTPDSFGSRLGAFVGTNNSGSDENLRVLALVEANGLDLYTATPIYSSGAATVTLTIDGAVVVANWGMFGSGYPGGGQFVQDHETCVMENATPGLHLIELDCATGAVGLYYMRTRPKLQADALKAGSATARYRKRWLDKFEITTSTTDSTLLFDDFPTSHLLRTLEIEFTSQLPKESGVVVGGLKLSSLAGPAVARQGVIVGIDASGFLSVWESTAPGTFTKTVLGAADLSLASHVYRFTLSPGAFGALTAYVDGVAIGAPVGMNLPYMGGVLGVWKQPTSTVLIDSLYYISAV